MTHSITYLGLIAALIGLSGCTTDDETAELRTEPVSLLRIKDGNEATEAPRTMLIRPELEAISVFYGFEENDEDFEAFEDYEGYENYELETYDVTDDSLEIVYDGRGLTLTDIDNRQYEDAEGNIYQLEFYTDNYEDN